MALTLQLAAKAAKSAGFPELTPTDPEGNVYIRIFIAAAGALFCPIILMDVRTLDKDEMTLLKERAAQIREDVAAHYGYKIMASYNLVIHERLQDVSVFERENQPFSGQQFYHAYRFYNSGDDGIVGEGKIAAPIAEYENLLARVISEGESAIAARPIALRPSPPYAVYSLVAMNVAYFILELFAGGAFTERSALSYAALVSGDWLRLVSHMFTHAGLSHLFFNMASLCIFGPRVERIMGHSRLLIIYTCSGLISGLLYVLVSRDVAVVGASGAVFALLGALAAVFVVRGPNKNKYVENFTFQDIIIYIIVSLMMGFFSPGVAAMAHVFGIAAGFLTASAMILTAGKRAR